MQFKSGQPLTEHERDQSQRSITEIVDRAITSRRQRGAQHLRTNQHATAAQLRSYARMQGDDYDDNPELRPFSVDHLLTKRLVDAELHDNSHRMHQLMLPFAA